MSSIPHSKKAIEGAHNKIKITKRVAYDYRNFLRFCDRI
ncbi:transposase [Enterococcus sp. AZ172]